MKLSLLLLLALASVSWAASGVKLKKPTERETSGIISLKDSRPILGKWVLEAVAPSLKGAKIPEKREWAFRPDGILVTQGWNRHFRRHDRQEFPYRIEGGKIITQIPGRKSELVYEVYKLDENSMILKGGMEGYYFLKRKQ